jgi:hypothetical protein
MSSYNPSIPQANDLISVSQGQLLNNFSQANVVIAADHYAFDDTLSGNEGLHKQVTFPVVKASDPTIVSPEGILYTKTSGGNSQLFYENSTAVTQLTGLNPSTNVQFRWGIININSGSQTYNFTTAFPTSCFAITNAFNDGTTPGVVKWVVNDRSSFTLSSSAIPHASYYYIAIGN